MGFGNFLKHLVNPLTVAKTGLKVAAAPVKAGMNATGKLVHGDFKGAVNAGTQGMIDPFKQGAMQYLKGKQPQGLTTPPLAMADGQQQPPMPVDMQPAAMISNGVPGMSHTPQDSSMDPEALNRMAGRFRGLM